MVIKSSNREQNRPGVLGNIKGGNGFGGQAAGGYPEVLQALGDVFGEVAGHAARRKPAGQAGI
ncbi:hypothetical protein MAUB_62590 (plasmid) [Mycolicibacterium aubagnense]|uniref:Uncharacterized protein n=1 Tax=Mycolicibacterium aubagnense TaxID=319707 RepID=A0ABM7IML4_9MYCO|nr:hypothetical protein MAUB_62590 [Mycolicibacterium aubagnense]